MTEKEFKEKQEKEFKEKQEKIFIVSISIIIHLIVFGYIITYGFI